VALIHLRDLILATATAPLIFYAAAIVCAWTFFRKGHRRTTHAADFAPPLSVLKPLRGSYRDTYRDLVSFCGQDYPLYEILFCVDDYRDPAVPVVHRLRAEFPRLSIRLLIGSKMPGANDKVTKLCRLAREARYDVLVVSDGDIRVASDYLRCIAAVFRDPRAGVVTCLYRGSSEPNVWSELEDLSLTTELLAGVLVARKLGVKFALGATMAVRRDALAAIGGFEALADAAADDHELGRRAARQGFRVELASTIPETECSTRDFRSYFRHHLRWAVVTRTSQPWGHVGFLFAQGLPWTIAAVAAAPSWRIAASFAAAFLILRAALAFTLGLWSLRDPLVKKKWWLLPLRDALGFLIWLASLVLSRVHWQDAAFDVSRGRLIPVRARPIAGEPPRQQAARAASAARR
jgi:ceramide glucosyltransferase